MATGATTARENRQGHAKQGYHFRWDGWLQRFFNLNALWPTSWTLFTVRRQNPKEEDWKRHEEDFVAWRLSAWHSQRRREATEARGTARPEAPVNLRPR